MIGTKVQPQLCGELLNIIKTFYSEPENMRKYEEWKRSKEEPYVRNQTEHGAYGTGPLKSY